MTEPSFRIDNLVLYKQRPARVIRLQAKKITIQDEAGKTLDVRAKDIALLHAGPVSAIPAAPEEDGELQDAWELLAGTTTTLAELAELTYGEFTPAAALALWGHVLDGLLFSGTPDRIEVRSADEVAQGEAGRAAKAAEVEAWNAFQARVRAQAVTADDAPYMSEIEELALGERTQSRTLRDLGYEESAESAHALLLRLGYWAPSVNPYPRRAGVPMTRPDGIFSTLPDEARLDLTHLQALAIDDAGNQDPDDALSIEGDRLWVHVADVAALVLPDDPVDLEARARGSNLYLPEGTVPMLPASATELLGLGLSETSPALSFGLDLDAEGAISALEIVPSIVRVTRLSYDEAEVQLEDDLLARLLWIAQRNALRRLQNGAIDIQLPEAKVELDGEMIRIQPLPALQSRMVVREAMLLAGEAVAQYAQSHAIPLAYTTQQPPNDEIETLQQAATLAQYFAVRRSIRPGRQRPEIGAHAGLGLACYVQSTSPLRRYLDLVAHQQLRAHLLQRPLLSDEEIQQRIGAVQAVMGSVRRAERSSISHWKHLFLQRNPGWSGEGVVVEKRGARYITLIPALAMESRLYLDGEVALDSTVDLVAQSVDLARLEATFRPHEVRAPQLPATP